VNAILCYFPWNFVLQTKQCVQGRNIDSTKVETIIGVQHFFIHAFKNIYITIWFCMLIEDVMEILTLLLSHNFIEHFVFIWGHEQCSMTLGQLIVGIYYYFKDLTHVGENIKKELVVPTLKPFPRIAFSTW